MEQKTIDYNALGQIIDTTWGRSSTSTACNASVKCRMHGHLLIVTFGVRANTTPRFGIPRLKNDCRDEALAVINAEIDRIKSDYREYVGRSIKLRQVDSEESVEVVNTSATSPIKTVLYRLTAVLEAN